MWAVAEALLQHDELAANWRARHVTMVERMIGGKSGTGGSSGAPYLRIAAALRYYPLLWDLRSSLTRRPRSRDPDSADLGQSRSVHIRGLRPSSGTSV